MKVARLDARLAMTHKMGLTNVCRKATQHQYLTAGFTRYQYTSCLTKEFLIWGIIEQCAMWLGDREMQPTGLKKERERHAAPQDEGRWKDPILLSRWLQSTAPPQLNQLSASLEAKVAAAQQGKAGLKKSFGVSFYHFNKKVPWFQRKFVNFGQNNWNIHKENAQGDIWTLIPGQPISDRWPHREVDLVSRSAAIPHHGVRDVCDIAIHEIPRRCAVCRKGLAQEVPCFELWHPTQNPLGKWNTRQGTLTSGILD